MSCKKLTNVGTEKTKEKVKNLLTALERSAKLTVNICVHAAQ